MSNPRPVAPSIPRRRLPRRRPLGHACCRRCHTSIDLRSPNAEAFVDGRGRIHVEHGRCPARPEWPATTRGVLIVGAVWLAGVLAVAFLVIRWWPALAAALADPRI